MTLVYIVAAFHSNLDHSRKGDLWQMSSLLYQKVVASRPNGHVGSVESG